MPCQYNLQQGKTFARAFSEMKNPYKDVKYWNYIYQNPSNFESKCLGREKDGVKCG